MTHLEPNRKPRSFGPAWHTCRARQTSSGRATIGCRTRRRARQTRKRKTGGPPLYGVGGRAYRGNPAETVVAQKCARTLRHNLFGPCPPRGPARGKRTERLRCGCIPGSIRLLGMSWAARKMVAETVVALTKNALYLHSLLPNLMYVEKARPTLAIANYLCT